MTSAQTHPAPLAVTMGEPAGVGGELILRCYKRVLEAQVSPVRPFFAIDDLNRLTEIATALNLDVNAISISHPSEVSDAFAAGLPVLDQPLPHPAVPGTPNQIHAAQVCGSIERAVGFVNDGSASAVVTNPIQKNTLYDAGFEYPGHTEYLAALAGIENPPVMMLSCEALRAIPVTVHVSLANALKQLTADDIVTKAQITAAALKQQFGISRPRLAVAGLNPHAGERGAMGDEEARIIEPAIEMLRNDPDLDVSGPWPPDTMFSPRARDAYDAAICMYHDQALIPVKTLDFDGAVNVTLGLPFIRTSPDHGTALDIAGQGIARPDSLMAALTLAHRMAEN